MIKKQEDGSMAIFCSNCGKQFEEGEAFCAACGMTFTTLEPAHTHDQQAPAAPEKKKMKIWVPVAAIAVVLALAFCALFFFTDIFKPGDDDGPTIGGTTTTSPGTSPGTSPSDPGRQSEPPSPARPPDPVDAAMPGAGGRLDVTGETNFEFTPNNTGWWDVYTTANVDCDPLLYVFDDADSVLAMNDDGGEELNSFITIKLSEGVAYRINAGFYEWNANCSYQLTVEPSTRMGSIMQMQGGGSLRIVNESEIEFTPDRSGPWGIWTSDNGTDDPLLILFDESGNILKENDDYGNSRNSYISYDLEAGTAYIVSAGFYSGTIGEYTLSIDYRTGPGRDNFNVDYTLPPQSGSHQVNDETVFLFTAPVTGLYLVITSDNGAYDPYLTIYDYYGDYIAHDDDYYDGVNAWLPVWLHEGFSYFLVAGFYTGTQGSYTLNVIAPEVIPGDGVTMRVNGETSLTFIPDESGSWEFRTSDNSRSEPWVQLFDARGNEIEYATSSHRDPNALMVVDLIAGETYTIHCGFWGYDRDYSYTLAIRRV